MTKLAAVLPAITPALVASVGASLAATALDSHAQRQHMKRQDASNRTWLNFQEQAKRDAERVEGQERDKAKMALDENLEANTEESRGEVIDAETERLSDAFTQNLTSTADDVIGGAQAPGRDQVFDDAMASGVANATSEARKRLQALAKATSYGGGSQWGMGQHLAQSGQRAGEDIGFLNMIRNDNTNLLRSKQSLQPEILEYERPLAVPLLQAGSAIMGGLGGDFWGKELFGGLGGGGGLASSIRPMARPGGQQVAAIRPMARPVSTVPANMASSGSFV